MKPNKLLKETYHLFILLISMAGYVPQKAPLMRTVLMIASLDFVVVLTIFQPHNSHLAISYFFSGEILYIGFITLVLSRKGLHSWFIKKWGKNKGYLIFQTLAGFLFFHNAAGIGYVASASQGTLFNFINKDALFIIAALLFIGGFAVKVWAAKVVTIDIYYWKDMFLGKKISTFVVTGPYKYFSNPMYGIGQIPAYAIAIWYGSTYGLAVAFLNQVLVFSFYFLVEKKFIIGIYPKAGPITLNS